MYPHKPLGEFLFELGQRFLDQVFPCDSAHGDVFEFSTQEQDVLYGNQVHPSALGHTQAGARCLLQAAQNFSIQRRRLRDSCQRLLQTRRLDRLQQVIDHV